MTKYVLQSGGMKNAFEKARSCFAEMVKDLGNNNPQSLKKIKSSTAQILNQRRNNL